MVPEKHATKKRILVVDDDRAVRDSLKKVLEEAGYAVVLASDGAQGAAQLAEQASDLLVLDLNLPKLSGFDILDLAAEHLPPVPVIILTGQIDQCEPGALAGADALMEKPPDVAVLLKLIERLLVEFAQAPEKGVAARPSSARPLPLLGTSLIQPPALSHPPATPARTESSG